VAIFLLINENAAKKIRILIPEERLKISRLIGSFDN
jgi:hypothetical protein